MTAVWRQFVVPVVVVLLTLVVVLVLNAFQGALPKTQRIMITPNVSEVKIPPTATFRIARSEESVLAFNILMCLEWNKK